MKKVLLTMILVTGMSVAVPAKAQERLTQIVLTVTIGTDDIRQGSVLTAQFIEPSGAVSGSVDMNRRAAIRPGGTMTQIMRLPRAMTSDEIRALSVRISFDGTPRNGTDPYDNFSVMRLGMSTGQRCLPGTRVGFGDGRPWARMTGEKRSETIPMTIPEAAGTARVNELSMEFGMGGDDLRGGAQASVVVRLTGNRSYPPIALNKGENWRGNSRKTVNITLPELTPLRDITGLELNFDGAGRNFGEGYDNWDIERITVTTLPKCRNDTIFATDGSLWSRFTQQDTSKTFVIGDYMK